MLTVIGIKLKTHPNPMSVHTTTTHILKQTATDDRRKKSEKNNGNYCMFRWSADLAPTTPHTCMCNWNSGNSSSSSSSLQFFASQTKINAICMPAKWSLRHTNTNGQSHTIRLKTTAQNRRDVLQWHTNVTSQNHERMQKKQEYVEWATKKNRMKKKIQLN